MSTAPTSSSIILGFIFSSLKIPMYAATKAAERDNGKT